MRPLTTSFNLKGTSGNYPFARTVILKNGLDVKYARNQIIVDHQSLIYGAVLSVAEVQGSIPSTLRHRSVQRKLLSASLETPQDTASRLDYAHIFSSSHQKTVSGGTLKIITGFLSQPYKL